MLFRLSLILLFAFLPSVVLAQGTVNSRVQAGDGTPITDSTAGRLDVTVQSPVNAAQSGTWNLNNISGTISLPTGAATETTLGTRLADSTFTGRFPSAFASADNIAAQTATFMHGGLMGWDGSAWDRLLATAGALHVSIQNASLPVTQSGSWTVTANAGTGTFFDGIVRDGTGDTTQANVSSGRLHVDGSGVTQPISGTVTANAGTGTFAVSGTVTANLAAGTNNIGDVDVLSLPALPAGTNNIGDVDIASIAAGDNNIGNVDVVTMPAVTQATASSLNAEVQGDAATDAAVSGNPVYIGGRAEDSVDGAPGVRVSAEGDATPISVTRDGTVRVVIGATQQWRYHENSSSALTDTTVHAAAGAGLYLYVCSLTFSTGAATAFNLFFEEGASIVLGPYYLEAVAGRGAVINFSPCNKMPTANTALTVTTSAAIAHSIDMTGYIAE